MNKKTYEKDIELIKNKLQELADMPQPTTTAGQLEKDSIISDLRNPQIQREDHIYPKISGGYKTSEKIH